MSEGTHAFNPKACSEQHIGTSSRLNLLHARTPLFRFSLAEDPHKEDAKKRKEEEQLEEEKRPDNIASKRNLHSIPYVLRPYKPYRSPRNPILIVKALYPLFRKLS